MKPAECFSRFYAQIHGLEDLPLPSPIHIQHPPSMVPWFHGLVLTLQMREPTTCALWMLLPPTVATRHHHHGGQNHQAEDILVMCVKQCYKPPVTGNGKHTTYKNGDLGGMVMALF